MISKLIFYWARVLSVKVLALKERIEKEQGSGFPVGGQKLIYAGEC